MSSGIFHPQTLGLEDVLAMFQQLESYGQMMDVTTLPSGSTLVKLEVLFFIDSSSLRVSGILNSPSPPSTTYPYYTNSPPTYKFASYLHSDPYALDYFLRRFWDWHCSGTLRYGLEFEVSACITH